MGRTLGSALTLSTIGLGSKLVVKWLANRFDVRGLPTLLGALKEPDLDLSWRKGKGKVVDNAEQEQRPKRRGIVTICNHNSVVDDPLMWTMLPVSHFSPLAGPSRVSRMNRWTLGASDVMFTNKIFSRFFENGQVIDTIRGGGIFQPAVDKAIKLLQDGEWIHIFPEGKIAQITINPEGGMRRFKWGVARIIMDAEEMPEVIPIWISRFDTLMPESRSWPRLIPRKGGNVSITIGKPLTSTIKPLVDEWKKIAQSQRDDSKGKELPIDGNPQSIREVADREDGREREIRIRICEVLQKAVHSLGVEVERKEGRFETGEWSHSTKRLDTPAAKAKVSDGTGETPI